MSPSAALALEPYMIINSDLLGSLTVLPEEVIEFPNGLFGFPECRSFVLVSTERDGLYWLQSVDHGTLAFLLVDPFLYVNGYEVELGTTELSELATENPLDVVILTIVTLPATREELPTTNLQGPVALNLRSRVGKQLALSEKEYGFRCPVDLLQAQ